MIFGIETREVTKTGGFQQARKSKVSKLRQYSTKVKNAALNPHFPFKNQICR
jgi:hypothetical protein